MVPEPGGGGSSETGTRDTKLEDGMSLPGAAAAPQARERFPGGQEGLGLGMHGGDAAGILAGHCSQGCCGWEQGLNESCSALIGSVYS